MTKINQLLIAIAALSWAAFATATPQSGLWWNPNEDGRGYAIDVQGDIAVVTTFAYDNNGKMQWYYSDGKLTNNGTAWKGALLKFDNGQCLSCAYKGKPTLGGSEGDMSIAFTSRTTGVLTLPGGKQTTIQRQNFGIGVPPDSLLGKWVYVSNINSSGFVDTFNYTQKAGATKDGSGVVFDSKNYGAAELQVKGDLAGYVFAFKATDATFANATNYYLFKLDMDEGAGVRASPVTNQNTHYLNVYKITTPSGLTKVGPLSTGGAAPADLNKESAQAVTALDINNKALTDQVNAVAERLLSALREQKAGQ